MEPGSCQTLRLTPVPNGVYAIRVSGWAVPNLTPDAQSEDIPLVPPYLHLPVLLKGLEARIFRFTLGEGSAKYQAAMGEYAAAVARAAARRDFAEGRVRQIGAGEESVQST